jgi:hypothetical protein
MQKHQLFYPAQQEKTQGKIGNEEALPGMQKAHAA